jgi:purine catabolism regulator
MTVTVRWLLAQRRLGLVLRGGGIGMTNSIGFVATTELTDPTPWLSGGEMVLTTGMGVPADAAGRRSYVQRLADNGAAALGFGAGLTLPSAPSDLVTAADEIGLPLLEVPLPTPFVAVAQTVVDETARQQTHAQTVAGKAQQRMTRAAVSGGPSATLRELSVGCSGPALLLDRHGRPMYTHPAGIDPEVLRQVGEQVREHQDTSAVGPAPGGIVVTQHIRVGRRGYGYLAVLLDHDPQPTDHVLIGHANSLLALDFEKPGRLRAAQRRMNAAALQLLMSAGADLGEAQRMVAEAADTRGLRVLVVLGAADRAAALAESLERHLVAAARPVFLLSAPDGGEITVVLRGEDDVEFADRLFDGVPTATRQRLLLGLSAPHSVTRLTEAVAEARLAARAGHAGNPPLDTAAMAGRTLLTDRASRIMLEQLAGSLLTPLREHDTDHDSALLPSLRAFLEHNGQWEGAATAAGVHRHTLRARIAKAEEIVGVDLDSARVRAELLLAMIATD